MRWAPIATVVAGSLALPGGASALVLAPPGHSGANQYFEVIPTSAGNAAPPGSVRGSGNATAGPHAFTQLGQGSKGDARLAKLGKDGATAAGVVAATAPKPAGRNAGGESSSPGGSPASGVSRALSGSDSGGLGLVLPLLLATALIMAVGIVVARVSRRTHSPGV